MEASENIKIGVIVKKDFSGKTKSKSIGKLKSKDKESIVYIDIENHKNFVSHLFSIGILAK